MPLPLAPPQSTCAPSALLPFSDSIVMSQSTFAGALVASAPSLASMPQSIPLAMALAPLPPSTEAVGSSSRGAMSRDWTWRSRHRLDSDTSEALATTMGTRAPPPPALALAALPFPAFPLGASIIVPSLLPPAPAAWSPANLAATLRQ
eukprot:scaffold66270_cov31-Tisochrysis_lutea.AAC.2